MSFIKDNEKENKIYLHNFCFFIIFDFIFDYLLILNVVLYKRNKKKI